MYKSKKFNNIKNRKNQPLVIGVTTDWSKLPRGAKVFYAMVSLAAAFGLIAYVVTH